MKFRRSQQQQWNSGFCFRFALGFAAVLTGLSACTFHDEKVATDTEASDVMDGHVSYAMVSQAVFTPSCAQCHGSAGGINLQNYASASANANQIRDAVFDDQSMPKTGTLDAYQMAMLKAWLDEGAPQEPGEAAPTGPSASAPAVAIEDLNYDNLNQQIFKPLCLKCHSNGVGVDLSTYQNVVANAGKISLAALAEQAMPPKTPLASDQSALLSAWIAAGTPETAPGATLQPTYESIYSQVFQPLCMNCHGSGKIAKNVPLAPYSALMSAKTKEGLLIGKTADASVLFEAINHVTNDKKRMPPTSSGLAALPQSTLDVISEWIDSGAPQGSSDSD